MSDEVLVLSHYARLGNPPRSPFISRSHQWDDDVIYVWLRESDDVLQECLLSGSRSRMVSYATCLWWDVVWPARSPYVSIARSRVSVSP
jgi:hypothetical protein